jgi:hypothetical protein
LEQYITKTKEVATSNWKEAMAKDAQQVATQVNHDGLAQISLKGGRMSLNDQLVAGDRLECIILAHTFQRAWYDREYSADDKAAPDCFAIGDDQYNMLPHENVPNPPSDNCKGCPMAEFGSAKQGAGPACKTRSKMVLLHAPEGVTADMISDKDAQLVVYNTQPTSVKAFAGKGGYLKKLAGKGLASWGVVTELSVIPHDRFLHQTTFEALRPLGADDLMEAAYSRIPEAEEGLKQAFTYEDDAEDKPAADTGTADSTKY